MGIINKSNKPSGGTDWQDGDIVSDSGSENLNTDFNTIYNEFNGNIENANIKASAAIAGTKLAAGAITDTQVSSTANIDPGKIGDYSATGGEQNTVSSPGDSDSNTLATDLEEELEQIRWAIRRTSLGDNAKITDGSSSGLGSDGNAAWFDGAVIGTSVIRNGSFLDGEADSTAPTPPYGWDVIDGGGGGPSTLTTVTLDVAEGQGHAIHMVDSNDVGRDGISQTLTGLKASSRYLIVARIKPIATTWKLTTTGATGTFGNLDLSTANGGSAWETLAGIIETDATPTDVVVNLIAGSALSECHIASCDVILIGGDKNDRSSSITRSRTSTSNVVATVESETTVKVVIPGPGYVIVVDGVAAVSNEGDFAVQQDIDAGGFADVALFRIINSGQFETRAFQHIVDDPTPGSVYSFRLTEPATSGTLNFVSQAGFVHRLTVELRRNG